MAHRGVVTPALVVAPETVVHLDESHRRATESIQRTFHQLRLRERECLVAMETSTNTTVVMETHFPVDLGQ